MVGLNLGPTLLTNLSIYLSLLSRQHHFWNAANVFSIPCIHPLVDDRIVSVKIFLGLLVPPNESNLRNLAAPIHRDILQVLCIKVSFLAGSSEQGWKTNKFKLLCHFWVFSLNDSSVPVTPGVIRSRLVITGVLNKPLP